MTPIQMQHALEAGFRAASLRHGRGESHDFLLGGLPVRFEIVGEHLAVVITKSFEHLRVKSGSSCVPALTVALWDAAATGVARPIPDLRDGFESHETFGDGVLASAHEGRLTAYQTLRMTTILDLSERRAVGWIGDASALSYFEIGKPLQPILFHWYARNGLIPLHAALVAEESGGILLCGPGGSGKSTSALACARAGLDFLGDDYVGITQEETGDFVGHSFYASAWLEEEHSQRLEWMSAHRLPGIDCGERKVSFSVAGAMPARLKDRATIRAIAAPRVTDAPFASFRRISPGEALRRLAPSTIFQLPFVDASEVMPCMGALVRRLPCYEIALGRDIGSTAQSVRAILDEAVG